MEEKLLQQAQELYCGFYIQEPVGNNFFSFDNRKHKKIFVPPLITGTPDEVRIGEEIVFVEIDKGKEIVKSGLKNFVYWEFQQKPVFIFDNHNHAFFFWLLAYKSKLLQAGLPLIHVDQHTDMRKPSLPPPFNLQTHFNLTDVFNYTNHILNVGNFIKPALNLGLFSQLHIINSSVDFDQKFEGALVLDIDLDIFAPELSYIGAKKIIGKVQEWLNSAKLITIATSPFFIDQTLALTRLHEIFNM